MPLAIAITRMAVCSSSSYNENKSIKIKNAHFERFFVNQNDLASSNFLAAETVGPK
jgi:hypothetical protein